MKETHNELSFRRTRIAPTPSGYLHIGNAASFLLTASFAKKANASLLLRIDDLDKERTQKKYVEDIFDTLRFLKIDWQEGPKDYGNYEQRYSQVHRLAMYEDALQQLRDEERVFACGCSRTDLQNGKTCHCRERKISLDKPYTGWRLITDEALPLAVSTITGERVAACLPSSMKSFVVRKKDGLPAYQLTSLIDDDYFDVDVIVRGDDLWESTLAQQYLALTMRKAFFQKIVFYHHPLVMDVSGNDKLSKSAGATSIRYLRDMGKTSEEVIAMINDIIAAW